MDHDGAEAQIGGLPAVESTGSCTDWKGVDVGGMVGLVVGIVVATGILVVVESLETVGFLLGHPWGQPPTKVESNDISGI